MPRSEGGIMKIKGTNRALFVVFFVTFSLVGSTVYGFDSVETRESLKDLKSVCVTVEDLRPEITKDGLTTDQIKNDVELKLRSAGIKVMDNCSECGQSNACAVFCLIPLIMKDKNSPQYICSAIIEIWEIAILTRTKLGAVVTTWSIAGTGYAPDINDVRNNIKDTVDVFTNAWFSVNQSK